MAGTAQGLAEWVAAERARNGMGVCCAEAQADGVPCPAPGCDCARCARSAEAYAAAEAEGSA